MRVNRAAYWGLLLWFGAVSLTPALAAGEERYLVGIGSGLSGEMGFRTEIQLVNPGVAQESGRIDFFNPEGAPKAVQLTPIWPGATGVVEIEEGGAGFAIPAGASLILVMEPRGPGELGWARLQAPSELGVRSELQVARFSRELVRESVHHRFEDAIQHISEVEPLRAGKRFMFPVWMWAGYQHAKTAVSVVNLSGAAADVRFLFRGGSTGPAQERTVTLRPGEFFADYFDRIWHLAFPAIFPLQVRATAEVVSSGEIAAAVFNTLEDLPVVAVKPFPGETPVQEVAAELGKEVELRVDDVAVFEAEGLSVRFWDVPVDSRCPIDVICVWQGEAAVALKLAAADGSSEELLLKHEGDDRRREWGGYRFELKFIEPAPESTRTLRVEEYRVRLLVDRAE